MNARIFKVYVNAKMLKVYICERNISVITSPY